MNCWCYGRGNGAYRFLGSVESRLDASEGAYIAGRAPEFAAVHPVNGLPLYSGIDFRNPLSKCSIYWLKGARIFTPMPILNMGACFFPAEENT